MKTPSRKRRAKRRKHLQPKGPRELRVRFVGGRVVMERILTGRPEETLEDHLRSGGLR